MKLKTSFPLILSCFSIVFALNSSLSGVEAQSGDSFKIRAEVNLVTVEVTVLDKKGNPVRNLKKEDFQLYEDGKKQEILSIDEVSAASEASPSGVNPIAGTTSHRGKTVLIVFADSFIRSQDIKTSRDSAERFVREHMRPQDLFAVAKFDISMKILQNFTSDRKDVLEAIRNAAGMSGAKPYVNDLLLAIDRINYSLAQIKGQKSILMYGPPIFSFPPSSSGRTSSSRGAASSPRDLLTLPDIVPPMVATVSPSQVLEFWNSQSTWGDTLKSALKSNVVYYTAGPSTADAELDKLDQKISNYYILGFTSSNMRHDGAIRRLEVKTPLNGLTLKYQPAYRDRRPVDALANTKQETTLLTALATSGTATQLPIIFRAAYFYDSPHSANVLVESRIRLERTTFKKKGEQLGTDLDIMGVAYGEDGSIAARISERLPVSFEKEKEAEFRKRDFAYRSYFKLRPGKYRLKLAVSDESGNLGSMERLLEIPALPDRGFAGSSLLIVEQASRLPDLISNLQSQMLDESNPLLYAGFQIEPRVENKLPANATLPVVFRLYKVPGAPDQWNLTAKARIIDEKGKEYSLGPFPLKNTMSAEGNAEAAVALRLPFKDVPPGKYRLIVETSEAASAKTATLETDLELTSPN
jgi:VWFA-related protein